TDGAHVNPRAGEAPARVDAHIARAAIVDAIAEVADDGGVDAAHQAFAAADEVAHGRGVGDGADKRRGAVRLDVVERDAAGGDAVVGGEEAARSRAEVVDLAHVGAPAFAAHEEGVAVAGVDAGGGGE